MPIYKGSIKVTSPYGPRKNPLTGRTEQHRGKDMVGQHSKQLLCCVAAARVLQVNHGHQQGRGTNVLLQSLNDTHHPGAVVRLRYQHLAATPLRVGQVLARGAVVGTQGNTGNSTGSHCHFEVTVNGTATDPTPWDGLPNRCGTYPGEDTAGAPGPAAAPPQASAGSTATGGLPTLWPQMVLESFGEKNMQGFSRPNNGEAWLVYNRMPAGLRLVTRVGVAATGGTGGFTWLELLDERDGRAGQRLYTPLLADRNRLLAGPALVPAALLAAPPAAAANAAPATPPAAGQVAL